MKIERDPSMATSTLIRRLRRMALAAGALLAAAPASAGIYPECPAGATRVGLNAAGDGVAESAAGRICVHLTAGDGWINYPTGERSYIFGFAVADPVLDNVMTRATFNAKFPAPTLAFRQNQEVYLALSNVGMAHRPDLFDPHSVHFHGFREAAPVYDGVPEASATVNMGSSFTYYYKLNDPGTYVYHCHVEATEHMAMGMLGNLYVRPQQNGTAYTFPSVALSGAQADVLGPLQPRNLNNFAYNDGDGSTGYDVEAALQLSSFDQGFHLLHEAVQPLPFETMRVTHPMINGRGYPDTINTATSTFSPPVLDDGSALPESSQPMHSRIAFAQVTAGRRLLLRISNLSVTDYFTVTAPGLDFRVVGVGASRTKVDPTRISGGLPGVTPKDWSHRTNSLTLGGGETVDVIIDTRGLATGRYTLYTSNLQYLSNGDEDRGGIMTHIIVN
jgi:FtsP/CotA-like multicopper oxidase with cupredoxin domain